MGNIYSLIIEIRGFLSREVIFCFRKYYVGVLCRIIWNGQRLKSERVIANTGDKSNVKAWNRIVTVAGAAAGGGSRDKDIKTLSFVFWKSVMEECVCMCMCLVTL